MYDINHKSHNVDLTRHGHRLVLHICRGSWCCTCNSFLVEKWTSHKKASQTKGNILLKVCIDEKAWSIGWVSSRMCSMFPSYCVNDSTIKRSEHPPEIVDLHKKATFASTCTIIGMSQICTNYICILLMWQYDNVTMWKSAHRY